MPGMNSPSAPQQPRLLDSVREAIRSRHYSRNTEDTYVAWIRRSIFVHGDVRNRGPADARSSADQLAIPPSPALPPPTGNRPAEIGRSTLQHIPVRSNAPFARPESLPSRAYPENPWPHVPK